MTDSNFQKVLTRHMGGSNLGFLDGHARWYPAKVILTQVNQDWSGFNGPDNTNNCTEPLLYGFASNYSGWH